MATRKSVNIAKEASNVKSNLTYNPIDNTPFAVVKQENEYWIILGSYVIEKGHTNEKEAIESAKDFSWNRVMQMISSMMHALNKQNEFKK